MNNKNFSEQSDNLREFLNSHPSVQDEIKHGSSRSLGSMPAYKLGVLSSLLVHALNDPDSMEVLRKAVGAPPPQKQRFFVVPCVPSRCPQVPKYNGADFRDTMAAACELANDGWHCEVHAGLDSPQFRVCDILPGNAGPVVKLFNR